MTTPEGPGKAEASPVLTPQEPPGPDPWSGNERRNRTVGWHSKDIARTAALVIAIYLAAQLLWFANPLVIVAFLGVLFGLAVEAGVDRLERFRVPRGVGAAMIVITFFAFLVGVGAMMAPTIREQSGVLRTRIPEAIDRVEAWINRRQAGFLGTIFGRGSGQATDSAGRFQVLGQLDAETVLELEHQFKEHKGVNSQVGQDGVRNDSGCRDIQASVEKVANKAKGIHGCPF